MDELSENYANALFSLLPSKDRPIYATALKEIRADLANEGDFLRLLCSRSLDFKEKEKMLDGVYGKKYEKLPHLLPTLKVICSHHRFNRFSAIVDAYNSLCNEELGIKEGIAFSAEKLSPAEMTAIEKALEKKLGSKVALTNMVDHTLLGGVKVSIDDKVFDGTLKGRLNELAKNLRGGHAQ